MALAIIALGGRQHGQAGQCLEVQCLIDRHQKQQAYPAQLAGFDQVRRRRMYRVPLNPLGGNLLSVPTLHGLVDSNHH